MYNEMPCCRHHHKSFVVIHIIYIGNAWEFFVFYTDTLLKKGEF